MLGRDAATSEITGYYASTGTCLTVLPHMRCAMTAKNRARSRIITPTSITIRRRRAAKAERLRERVGGAFPQAKLGRWHDELVGPHPQSMFQIAFPTAMLADFVPWLMLNRDGLTVLLHPETGDDYTDHSAHAAWFGAVLPLRLEVFKKK